MRKINTNGKGMVTAIIRTEIRDFTERKKAFDADQPNVEKAGARLMGAHTSAKSPIGVTMICEALNTETYDLLMSDPERQGAIKRSGVIGFPVATFLHKA